MFGRRKKDKAPRTRDPSALRGWWRGLEEERRASAKRRAGWACALVLLAGAAAAVLWNLERYVLRDKPRAAPVSWVVSFPAPRWMPPSLIQSVALRTVPEGSNFNDPQLTERIARQVRQMPWVRKVHRVEKRLSAGGKTAEIEVQAEFRRPIAAVQAERQPLRYVDVEGVVLPEAGVPRLVARTIGADGREREAYFAHVREVPQGVRPLPIHYIVIQGVKAPPPDVGSRWGGQDLADGLRVAAELIPQPYANQCTVVDVTNHDRHEPGLSAIVIYAQIRNGRETKILFGRFSRPDGDFEVSTERKLSYLDKYASWHEGRVAGLSRFIDLRHDELRFSRN